MAVYSLDKFVGLQTTKKVYKVCKNGKCLWDIFVSEIKRDGNLIGHLDSLSSILESAANGLMLPDTRWKHLKTPDKSIKIYEAKKDILRMYVYRDDRHGYLVVFGGKKNDQKEDIKRLIQNAIEINSQEILYINEDKQNVR